MADDSELEDLPEEEIDESYHDDPELLVDIPRRNIFAGFAAFLMLLAGTSFYLPSTVGARIVLNSSATSIQFGQGSSLFVYCGGAAAQIQVNLGSYFSNQTSTGNMYLKQIQLSQIPRSCSGAEFTVRIYNDVSSTPLTLFGTTSQLVVDDTSGTFFTDCTLTEIDVSSTTTGSGDGFIAVFATPILLSTSIAKMTIETRNQTLTIPPLIDIGSTFIFSSGAGSDYRNGPTLPQLQTQYSATPWTQNTSYLNVVTQGYQRVNLCFAGTYEFTVLGANGAKVGSGSGGGNGATVKGRFTFNSKQALTIVVGQSSLPSAGSAGGGGGGGSFVFLNGDTTTTGVLVAAGGGGGFGGDGVRNDSDAKTTTSGGVGGIGGSGCSTNAGGIDGNGGAAYTVANPAYQGGGGAGITTSGQHPLASYSGGAGGKAISISAIGGGSGYSTFGGFGGGGGGTMGAGGGGGYSGGGGGFYSVTGCTATGGGGGSYISNTATNTSFTITSNSQGYVKITRIS